MSHYMKCGAGKERIAFTKGSIINGVLLLCDAAPRNLLKSLEIGDLCVTSALMRNEMEWIQNSPDVSWA